jgi:GTP cyclohydrolase IA
MRNVSAKAVAAVRTLLDKIGEDPAREGLAQTPQRYVNALLEWTSGYEVEPQSVLTWFKDGADTYDQLLIVRDIPFYSLCEHHVAPFFGRAHIAYIPDGSVVGLSKLPRLLEVFARRLQVQERLTNQVADALWTSAGKPKGVGVVIEARHMCMESRGINRPGCVTITSALRGCIREEPDCRAEFLALTRSNRDV